ncbi:hypothetical protein O6H91_17G046400 [Diphasiastrum complanatum]|uniref:Uncharacterized protein n=1 Tax=Diphasiastrum complanatum TaxID=34168 RepID=A0ACC2B6K6_DIPCM|nr:hypothetical protein O6H91_17G046400 [Diphasiastrum complanatum]
MKILEANAGLLSNFEVLDLLRSRGADKGFLGAVGAVTPSECKVYDYLVQSPAGTQTREKVQDFLKEAEQYSLTKAERLQASNIRPISAVEVHLIVEDCDERLSSAMVDRFVGSVEEKLPPPPEQSDETAEQGETEMETE